MNPNATAKRLRFYVAVLYVLLVIQWFWAVRHEYLLVADRLQVEISSNIMDIWAQLTPMSKFLTVILFYITLHLIVVGIKKIFASRKARQ
jgi:hypothetical protein